MTRLALASFLLAATPAFAQTTTPLPPLPPVQLHSQGRVLQMHIPHGEAGGDLGIIPSGTWWRYPETIKQLSLTPDQQHKMDDIFRQNRIQLIDLKASLEKEQLNLEPILNTNPPDTNKALAEISRIADLRADLEKANARMLLGLRALLTADQWTTLQSHRPGFSFSSDNGRSWQSRLDTTRSPGSPTTCTSDKGCSITTVNTRRDNKETVTTTCVSTSAQATPKCTTSTSTGKPLSFNLTLPAPAPTPSFRIDLPDPVPATILP